MAKHVQSQLTHRGDATWRETFVIGSFVYFCLFVYLFLFLFDIWHCLQRLCINTIIKLPAPLLVVLCLFVCLFSTLYLIHVLFPSFSFRSVSHVSPSSLILTHVQIKSKRKKVQMTCSAVSIFSSMTMVKKKKKKKNYFKICSNNYSNLRLTCNLLHKLYVRHIVPKDHLFSITCHRVLLLSLLLLPFPTPSPLSRGVSIVTTVVTF